MRKDNVKEYMMIVVTPCVIEAESNPRRVPLSIASFASQFHARRLPLVRRTAMTSRSFSAGASSGLARRVLSDFLILAGDRCGGLGEIRNIFWAFPGPRPHISLLFYI